MFSLFSKPSSNEPFIDVTANSDVSGDVSTLTPDASAPPTPQNGPRKTQGTISEIRTLYEGPHDDEDKWEFQAEYPEDLVSKNPAPGKLPPNKLYAVVIRETRTGSKSQPLKMDTLTVQSPHIKRALAELLPEYRNVDEISPHKRGPRNPVFRKPFRELYHAWPQYVQRMERAHEGGEEKRHLRLFYELARKDVERLRRKQLALNRTHRATFDALFTVFRPGVVVFAAGQDREPGDGCEGGFERFYRVLSIEHLGDADCPRSLNVVCSSLEWDGVRLGWSECRFGIDRFSGPRKLTELKVFPAELHPEYEAVRARLLERGRRWSTMRKQPVAVDYRGPTPEMRDGNRWGLGKGVKMVNGRVMIDPAAWEAYGSTIPCSNYHTESYFKPELELDKDEGDDDDDDDEHDAVAKPAGVDEPESDSEEEEEEEEQKQETTETEEEDESTKPLTDDELVLTSHILFGFCLKTKSWVKVYIDLAKEVPWNYEAFDRLVLPGNYKQLVLAFVESQAQSRDVFDDIIEGKGQGIIMLLHGPPGLGKTLTAEAVSDRLEKPLYSVAAGELGSEASEVENNLERILEVAAKWDAVLLLDEADVFLEQRHHSDLERNKIVSVFLRLLEYYRGILFVTSNRVETFDEAFRSRIHLKIHYPDLDAEAKIGIWRNFIEASRKKNGSNVTDADIQELAKLNFNGREIKNMVKTAQLLASREKWPLEMRHFRVCMDALV